MDLHLGAAFGRWAREIPRRALNFLVLAAAEGPTRVSSHSQLSPGRHRRVGVKKTASST